VRPALGYLPVLEQAINSAKPRPAITNYDQDRLLHLDAATGKVLRRWEVGGGPRDVLATAGSVWVANSRSPTLTRLRLSG